MQPPCLAARRTKASQKDNPWTMKIDCRQDVHQMGSNYIEFAEQFDLAASDGGMHM